MYAKFHHNIPLSSTQYLTISWGTSCQYQCVYKIHHNIPLSSRNSTFITFSEFGAWQSLDHWKCYFAIPWARSFQHQIVCNIPNGLRVNFHFFFFLNLNLVKTSTNPKCHLTISWATSYQYTNVYAKFHHNIPLSLKNRAIFTFSEFGARQNLDRWKMIFQNLLGYILIISMFKQKSIKIFHSVQETRPFSLFQNLALGKVSTDNKCYFAIVLLFSEFEPRQKLNQSQIIFDHLMGYILSISMCIQNPSQYSIKFKK